MRESKAHKLAQRANRQEASARGLNATTGLTRTSQRAAATNVLLANLLDEQRRTNDLLESLSRQLAAGAVLTLPSDH